jgi:hypothetical protein
MWSTAARFAIAMSLLSVPVMAVTDADPPPPQAARREAEPGQKAPTNAPRPAAGAGVVVFIDPATGKIVQPSAEELGTTVAPQGAAVAPKAPVTVIQGPGNTIGVLAPPESFSYAVAVRTADGKLATDCVTGEKAASERLAAGASRTTGIPPVKGSRDEKR